MTFPLKQLMPKDFPALLKEIADPPSSLYMRGSLPEIETVYLCVVGSRACTPYGRRMTQKLIAGLRGYPIAIVSGLAIGLDSEAHRAAMDVGLHTIANKQSSRQDVV